MNLNEVSEETKRKYGDWINLMNVINGKIQHSFQKMAESLTEKDMKQLEKLMKEKTYAATVKHLSILVEKLDLQPEGYAPNWRRDVAKYYNVNEELMICPNCGKSFDVDNEMTDKICCPECGGIAKSKDKKVNDGQSYENEESIFEAIKKEWLDNIRRGGNS